MVQRYGCIIKAATPKSFDENAMDFEVAAMFFCAGLFDFDLHCDCFCQRIIISITCRRYFDFQLVRTLLQPLLYCNIASFADCDLLISEAFLKVTLPLALLTVKAFAILMVCFFFFSLLYLTVGFFAFMRSGFFAFFVF